MVALTNTIGGRILLGVRDIGTAAGIENANAIRASIQDIAWNCDPPVKVLVIPLGQVMVVQVSQSIAMPVQCKEGFYWRQGGGHPEAHPRRDTRVLPDRKCDPIRSIGLVEMIISDKPRSTNQRYRLTSQGHKFLRQFYNSHRHLETPNTDYVTDHVTDTATLVLVHTTRPSIFPITETSSVPCQRAFRSPCNCACEDRCSIASDARYVASRRRPKTSLSSAQPIPPFLRSKIIP